MRVSVSILALVAIVTAHPTIAADAFCPGCISVRTGPPMVVRGPFADELDNHFVLLQLSDGLFRGFSANGETFAVDGPDILAMGGSRRAVFEPGPPGSEAECGRWLDGVARAGGHLYGLVRQESDCDYDAGRTHKTMAMAVSDDDGLTWTDLGTFLSGADAPMPRSITGEGDCTMVDGADGYLYAYCLRNSDWQTIVARAPVDDPRPGQWRKFHDGRFDSDTMGGPATAIGFHGTASGFIRDFDRIATIAIDPWFKGLRLSLSSDKVTFADVAMPIVPIDDADWNRPADTGLVAYVSIVNPTDGSNTVGRDFLIAYIYVPPGKDFSDRYLVFQEVRLDLVANRDEAYAGVALTRWRGQDGFTRTSTAPMIDATARPDALLGYLLTATVGDSDTSLISECLVSRIGADYYMLVAASSCPSGSRRLGTAGFAFSAERPGSAPLYRCRDAATGFHFGSNAADCEGGEAGTLLGYALAE